MDQDRIQKTTEIPQLQCLDEVIPDVPAVFVEQVPHVHVVAEDSRRSHGCRSLRTLRPQRFHMVRGTETSESLEHCTCLPVNTGRNRRIG